MIAEEADDGTARAWGFSSQALKQAEAPCLVGASIKNVAGLHESRIATGPVSGLVDKPAKSEHLDALIIVAMKVADCYNSSAAFGVSSSSTHGLDQNFWLDQNFRPRPEFWA